MADNKKIHIVSDAWKLSPASRVSRRSAIAMIMAGLTMAHGPEEAIARGLRGGIVLAGGFFGAQNDIGCYAGSGSLYQSSSDGSWHATACQIMSSSTDTQKVDNNSVVTGDGGDSVISGVKIAIGTDGSGNRPWYGYTFGVGGYTGSNTTNTDLGNIITAYKTIGGY